MQSERAPVGAHILVVLLESASEAVVSAAIGNKIEEVRGVGMQGRFESAFSGIRNRSWGQTWIAIGVVDRVYGEVGVMKGPIIGSGKQLGVDYAGISVESHFLVQPVVIHTSYSRSLFRSGRFFFHDGSHGDYLGHIGIWRRAEPDFACNLSKLMNHHSRHFFKALSTGELIGIGKKVAFERLGIRRDVGDQLSLAPGHLEKIDGRA